MIAALAEVGVPPGGWTTTDLYALPEDNHHLELIDGVLLVSPSPTSRHQRVSGLLFAALDRACPDHLAVNHNVDIRLSEDRSLCPDVLVTTVTDDLPRFAPNQVVLAVEIVSPGSRTMDRITKPALYAEAGIPYYWRIETAPSLLVHAYRLDEEAGAYTSQGTFDETVELDEPWAIKIAIAELEPRRPT